MKKYKLLAVIFIIIALLSLSGCKNNEQAAVQFDESAELDTAILGIMADRLTALENDDYDLFMSSIGTNNELFYNEMIRWYDNMSDDIISHISFEIISVEMQDENTGVVNIRQKHKLHYDGIQYFDFEYPLLLNMKTTNGWITGIILMCLKQTDF